MQLLALRVVTHAVYALAERPLRHRRHAEVQRTYQAPPSAWWAGDARWFPADFPPRPGNRLTPLVDGRDAMRAMYEAMENARESIVLATWFLTPALRMLRPPEDCFDPREGRGGSHAFLSLVARKADEVDVRILLWCGARAGSFATSHVTAVQQALACVHPRLRVRVDTHERFAHSHHQKTLVVDGHVAFVGGLDITAFDADRWDIPEHPYRPGRNWHDAHWKIEGPCVADVATNFAQRWNAGAPDDPVDAPPVPAPIIGGSEAQVQRTVPTGIYTFAPRGIFGIAHAYCRAIARAERFIYLESQYLWSPEITEALCDAIQRGVQIALVLPSHPNVGKADTDLHVEALRHADARLSSHGGACVFRAYTLYTSWRDEARGCYRFRPIYVHAKVAIIDDEWVTAGSANLNGRGLATDTEMNVSTINPAVARALRLRLWSEHLACPEDDLRDADPVALLRERWPACADEQRSIVKRRSGPLTAALYPYALGHMAADFGPGELESALLDR